MADPYGEGFPPPPPWQPSPGHLPPAATAWPPPAAVATPPPFTEAYPADTEAYPPGAEPRAARWRRLLASGVPTRPDGSGAEGTAGAVARPAKTVRQRIAEIETKKVNLVKLMHFCRHMAVFLAAGVPILDALETVRTDCDDKRLQRMIVEMSASLRGGDNLTEAVAPHDKALPPFFVSMIRAAEETGQLAEVLKQVADYIERDVEARRKTKSALLYPSIVVGLSVVSVAVLVAFVLPRFVTFFEEFDAELPLPTRMLVWVSNALTTYGAFFAIGLVAAVLLVVGLTTLEKGRLWRDRALLKLPLVARTVNYAVVERFCRILSSMVQAGVPLPVALDLASKGGSNRAFGERLAVARQRMVEGEGLSEPLAATEMFPATAIQMLRVGEETGTLEARLDEISTFYGKELEYRLKRLTDMLEPLSVVIVGVLVGFVALAIVSAIYGVFNGTDLGPGTTPTP